MTTANGRLKADPLRELAIDAAAIGDDQAERGWIGAKLAGADSDTPSYMLRLESTRIISDGIDDLRAEGALWNGTGSTLQRAEENGFRVGRFILATGRWTLREQDLETAIEACLAVCHVPEHVDTYSDAVEKAYARRQAAAVHVRRLSAALAGDTATAVAGTDFDVAAESTRRPFAYLTAAELDDGQFHLEYLIDGLLVRGQPGVVGGPKKGLKTNLLIDLAISLATGGWFLQKFKVNKPLRVLFISGESGRATIQETARRIARAKGLNLRNIDRFIPAFDLPILGDPRSERELRRFIEKHEIDVVIIDPLYLAAQVGDDASSIFKMGNVYKGLSRLAADLGVTPLLAHHYKKHAPIGELPDLDWLAWAGLAEWARQWILLNRREKFDPAGDGDHKLWLLAGGSAGHTGLWGINVHEGTRQTPGGRVWEVDVVPAIEARSSCATSEQEAREAQSDAKRQRTIDANLKKFLDALAKTPNGNTKNSIKALAGINGSVAADMIVIALQRDLIEEFELIKNRRPETGFRLKTARSDNPGQLSF